jgi:hypothetical protein
VGLATRMGTRVKPRSAWWTTVHPRPGVRAAGRGSASRRRRRSAGASGCGGTPACRDPERPGMSRDFSPVNRENRPATGVTGLSQPCNNGSTSCCHRNSLHAWHAVDRGDQQAAHAPKGLSFGDEVGAESQLSFEHQVACGGPGGSPHATTRCVDGARSREPGRSSGHPQRWAGVPLRLVSVAGPGRSPRRNRPPRRVDGLTRVW